MSAAPENITATQQAFARRVSINRSLAEQLAKAHEEVANLEEGNFFGGNVNEVRALSAGAAICAGMGLQRAISRYSLAPLGERSNALLALTSSSIGLVFSLMASFLVLPPERATSVIVHREFAKRYWRLSDRYALCSPEVELIRNTDKLSQVEKEIEVLEALRKDLDATAPSSLRRPAK